MFFSTLFWFFFVHISSVEVIVGDLQRLYCTSLDFRILWTPAAFFFGEFSWRNNLITCFSLHLLFPFLEAKQIQGQQTVTTMRATTMTMSITFSTQTRRDLGRPLDTISLIWLSRQPLHQSGALGSTTAPPRLLKRDVERYDAILGNTNHQEPLWRIKPFRTRVTDNW